LGHGKNSHLRELVFHGDAKIEQERPCTFSMARLSPLYWSQQMVPDPPPPKYSQPLINSNVSVNRPDLPSSTDHEAANFPVNTVLDHRYQILERLGLGGMGAVYRSVDQRSGEEVAIKIMLPSLLNNKNWAARFAREAEVMKSLKGPGIVAVYDIGEDTSRQLRYYTMELLNGVSLRDLISYQQDQKHPLDQILALEIIRQSVLVLAPAHARNMVHRDLKPGNLFLKGLTQEKLADPSLGDIEVIVLDFGIVKAADNLLLTKTQAHFGTIRYMAPEQEISARQVDQRADLFSLAVIFHELLCHRLPMTHVVSEAELSGLAANSVRCFLMRGLAQDAEQRFAHGEDMLGALDELNDQLTGVSQSSPIAVALPLIIVAIFLGFSFFYLSKLMSTKKPLETKIKIVKSPSNKELEIVPALPLLSKIGALPIGDLNVVQLSFDHQSKRLYLAGSFARGRVMIVNLADPSQPRLIKSVPGSGVVVDPREGRYYSSSGYQGEIIVYNSEDDSVLGRIKVGFCGGYFAMNPNNDRIYMGSQCGNGNDPVHIINSIDGQLIKTPVLKSSGVCLAVYVNHTTDAVYVHRGDGKTRAFMPRSNYTSTVDFPGVIVAIDSHKNQIYLRNKSAALEIYHGDSHKRLKTISDSATVLAIDGRRRRLYCAENEIIRVRDTIKNAVITTFKLAKSSKITTLNVDPKQQLIFVVAVKNNEHELLIIKDRS
jgi:serine/threonine protein kinase